jgi:hypothetical protein
MGTLRSKENVLSFDKGFSLHLSELLLKLTEKMERIQSGSSRWEHLYEKS